MFTYKQSTGEMFQDHPDPKFDSPGGWIESKIGSGYSGRNAVSDTGSITGRNNHAAESLKSYGPIPCGNYTIGPARDTDHLGPCAMPLTPAPENTMFDRSDFWIHGDNTEHDASHGCIIMTKFTRELIAAAVEIAEDIPEFNDKTLRVIE